MPEKNHSIEPMGAREKKREDGSSRYTRGANNPRGRNQGSYRSVKDEAKYPEHDTKERAEEHSKENNMNSIQTGNTSNPSCPLLGETK